MTDDRYKLYLASFCAKLLGRPVVEMEPAKAGDLRDIAVCALALADAGLGVPQTRAEVDAAVTVLLEVQ